MEWCQHVVSLGPAFARGVARARRGPPYACLDLLAGLHGACRTHPGPALGDMKGGSFPTSFECPGVSAYSLTSCGVAAKKGRDRAGQGIRIRIQPPLGKHAQHDPALTEVRAGLSSLLRFAWSEQAEQLAGLPVQPAGEGLR
jgi:hypothetical protein